MTHDISLALFFLSLSLRFVYQICLSDSYTKLSRYPSVSLCRALCASMATNGSRQGQIYDDYSNPDFQLCFACNDDVEDLCRVINWAYRGKPSESASGESYSGWIGEQHLLSGARITQEELKKMIDDEQNYVILVAKLKTASSPKSVGCCKVSMYDKKLQIGEEEEKDIAVEFGLNAVDPDYQSRGIGTLLVDGAMVSPNY